MQSIATASSAAFVLLLKWQIHASTDEINIIVDKVFSCLPRIFRGQK